jgi:hypothetical protein
VILPNSDKLIFWHSRQTERACKMHSISFAVLIQCLFSVIFVKYVCIYVYRCIYVYVCVCIYMCIYLCMYVCTYLCIYVCIFYVCINACIYVCMYSIYVHMFVEFRLELRYQRPFLLYCSNQTTEMTCIEEIKKQKNSFFQEKKLFVVLLL